MVVGGILPFLFVCQREHFYRETSLRGLSCCFKIETSQQRKDKYLILSLYLHFQGNKLGPSQCDPYKMKVCTYTSHRTFQRQTLALKEQNLQ